MSKSVLCPLCAGPATIMMSEHPDLRRGTEGHRIEFVCALAAHELSEVEMLRLWAADRASAN